MFNNHKTQEVKYDSQDEINKIIQDATSTQSADEYKINYERIKRAPKIVQDYYNGTGVKFERGLFKVLVAKKSNRNIFMIMLFMLVITFITSNLSNKSNLAVINGYECELTSFAHEQTTYMTVKVHPIKKTKLKLEKSTLQNSLPIQISFTAIDTEGRLIQSEEIIKSSIFLDTEIYTKTIEHYNIKKVFANILIGDKAQTINLQID